MFAVELRCVDSGKSLCKQTKRQSDVVSIRSADGTDSFFDVRFGEFVQGECAHGNICLLKMKGVHGGIIVLNCQSGR